MTSEDPEATRHPETADIYDTAVIVNEQNLELGENVEISDHVFLNAGERTAFAEDSCIHAGSRVVGGGELLVGAGVAITYNCVIVTSAPATDARMSTRAPVDQKIQREAPVEIRDEAFVGSNSVVMPGVTIGEGAVVAALSYVDEDVPPWTVRYPDGGQRDRTEVVLRD